MGCSIDLLSLAENVFVFPILLLFGIPWVQQGMKCTFPIWRVTAGQADWCWVRVGVGKAEEQHIQSPSTLAQASRVLTKLGYPGQSDHPCGRVEGARKLQPKYEVCWSCNKNNYHDTFLLPLTTAGSVICNIPSASLPKHKLGREALTEMRWPGSNRELSASRWHTGSTWQEERLLKANSCLMLEPVGAHGLPSV